MARVGAVAQPAEAAAAALAADGKTPMLVAIDGRLAGVVAVADTIKDGSAAAIAALRARGIDVVMMTGDNRLTAAAIARQVGVVRVVAEVLPEHKASEVRRLQREGRIVGMVGDGINDAPALAQADVGSAIGTGTDVAIESSDITLISGALTGLVTAVDLSRATMRNIRQNLVFAFVYNGLGIPVAAGVLYPSLGIRLSPIIAAAAMALSSLSVVANANRLHHWAPSPPSSRRRTPTPTTQHHTGKDTPMFGKKTTAHPDRSRLRNEGQARHRGRHPHPQRDHDLLLLHPLRRSLRRGPRPLRTPPDRGRAPTRGSHPRTAPPLAAEPDQVQDT